MTLSDFSDKEVINIKDCKKLGHVTDLEFDERNGCICKIIVSNKNILCSFFKPGNDYCICYKDIRQIGPDIILVDLCL